VTVTRPQRNHHKARLEPQACRPAPSQKQEPHSATRTRGWLPCLEAYIQWATGRVSWPESTTKDRNLAYLAGSVDPRTAARQVDRLKPRRPDPQPLSRDRETLQPADRGVNRRMLDLRAYRRLDLLGHVVSAPDRQSSGTRMCTDTKARLPAARVRTAWNWTSSFVKPRKTASTRAPSPSGSAIHQTTDEAPYERNRRRDDVGRDEQRDDRIEPLPAGDRHRGHADNDPDRRP